MDTKDFIENVNRKRDGAWKEMYRRFYPALCNYARRIVDRPEAAEDIVQECFIRIWDGDMHFPDVPSLTAYLYRMVYNRALNLVRDKGVAEGFYEFWGEEQKAGQEEDQVIEVAVEEDVINRFYKAIEELPEQQRQILLMSMEGAKVQDIANTLSISENTVKTQKKRAYAYVREQLGTGIGYLVFLLFS